MIVLAARGVTLRFGRRARRPAVRDVAFDLAAGEIVGLVGPNGAGKSTLLRILAGEVQPDEGDALVTGIGATRRTARRRVGWAPDPPVLPPELSGLEWLWYLASHRAHHPAGRAAGVRQVIELAELEAFIERRIATYSRGMAQRLALAGAVLSGDVAVLLDETLSGIDPLVQRRLRERLAGLARAGRVVIIASHDLGTVERLATRVLILADGQLRSDVRMHALLGERVMELALDGSALAAAPALCARFPGAARTAEGIAIPLSRGLTPEQVLAACHAQRVAVAATRVRYRALDDVLAATVEPD